MFLLKVAVLSVLLPLREAFELRTWEDADSLARNVVAQMTLDEKLKVVIGTGQLNAERRCVGDTNPVSRLGIPSICFQDGPAGMRPVKNVTGFPTAINAASTFSRRLMRARGVALGDEFRIKGAHVYLGPAVDIMRNPKMGRAWESFGPDPYLNGEGAYETVMGVQSVGVQACAKHLLGNNQEHWRYGLSANLDDRTMHEMYFYPFLRSIEANVSSVMCAYNRFNGTSSCHNAGLLGPNGILRKAGFKGFVVSDWGATHDSAAENANAGLDMEQPGDWIAIGGGVYRLGLKSGVNSGKISKATLDTMVVRILTPFYRLGQDLGYPPVNFDAQRIDGTGPRNLGVNARSAEHTALAKEIAAASSVLLKNAPVRDNSGTIVGGLPVVLGVAKTVAIIGQDARMPRSDCGELNECNDGTMVAGWGSGSILLDHVVPPISAFTSHIGNSAKITTSLSNNLDEGVNAARGKDMAFVFVNAMSGELSFYHIVVGNMGDRNDLKLWWSGNALVERVAAVCKNTIVVVHSVGPVYMPWSDHPNVTAIVYAGAPGEQTGEALVDVVYGAYNPSGRLPFTIADSEDGYGTTIVYDSNGFPDINYSEKLLLDYRSMDALNVVPRFEFGFGLSYTTFEYSALSISASGEAYHASFTVKNTGSLAGTEKPQLYLGYPASAGEPKKVLRNFEEVTLKVGESKTVTMILDQRSMSVWDTPSQSYKRPSGIFTVYIGASIRDIRLTGAITRHLHNPYPSPSVDGPQYGLGVMGF